MDILIYCVPFYTTKLPEVNLFYRHDGTCTCTYEHHESLTHGNYDEAIAHDMQILLLFVSTTSQAAKVRD